MLFIGSFHRKTNLHIGYSYGFSVKDQRENKFNSNFDICCQGNHFNNLLKLQTTNSFSGRCYNGDIGIYFISIAFRGIITTFTLTFA